MIDRVSPRGARGGRPRKLPDVDELRRLKKEVGTNEKVGAMFGVSAEAVRKALAADGQKSKDDTWQQYWPKAWWTTRSDGRNRIATRHYDNYLYRMVLFFTKRRQGGELRRGDVSQLDEFLDHMRKNDLVVYYDYEHPTGFRLRSRREHDDPNEIWVDGP
jgi:hypothetical protein